MVRKKILFVFGSSDIGGAEKQALYLIRYILKHQLFDVTSIVYSSKYGALTSELQKLNIEFNTFENPLNARNKFNKIKNLLNLLLLIRKHSPNIIIPYTNLPNVTVNLIWRFTGAKLSLWNQRDSGVDQLNFLLEQLSIANSSLIISNSKSGLNYLRSKFYLFSKNTYTIPNGIEINPKKEKTSRFSEIIETNKGKLIGLMVANLSDKKDHHTLILAWKKLVTNKLYSNAVLLFAGRFDSEYLKLKTLISALNLENQIILLGEINDVSELIAISDLTILTSFSEGCPNALLEYCIQGKPFVGSDIDGIREFLCSESIQFLSNPLDHNKLAANIELMFSDENLRKKLGFLNKMHVEKNFNNFQSVSRILEILN
jgi:glycosyltransferase involved in cell wall biosynthesis